MKAIYREYAMDQRRADNLNAQLELTFFADLNSMLVSIFVVSNMSSRVFLFSSSSIVIVSSPSASLHVDKLSFLSVGVPMLLFLAGDVMIAC